MYEVGRFVGVVILCNKCSISWTRIAREAGLTSGDYARGVQDTKSQCDDPASPMQLQ